MARYKLKVGQSAPNSFRVRVKANPEFDPLDASAPELSVQRPDGTSDSGYACTILEQTATHITVRRTMDGTEFPSGLTGIYYAFVTFTMTGGSKDCKTFPIEGLGPFDI